MVFQNLTIKRIQLVRLLIVVAIVGICFYQFEVLPNLPKLPDTSALSQQSELVIQGYDRIEYNDDKFGFTKVEFINRANIISISSPASILLLSIVASGKSYGKGHTYVEFLKKYEFLTSNSNYRYNLGILISDDQEFTKINQFLTENTLKNFEKITLIQAKFIDESNALDRENRHDNNVQRFRRRLIARIRNFCLFNCLTTEQYTVFIDSDIIEFKQPNMIDLFIDTNYDIIVPRIQHALGDVDYDRNSWKGERTKPDDEELKKMDKNDWDNVQYVPQDVSGKIYHFYSFMGSEDKINHPELTYAFPLDSVGGAILFAKSIIYKQGVNFPTSYIVGTTWDRDEGYDGIETEGICYLAKPLGYKCWGMPNIVAIHSSD